MARSTMSLVSVQCLKDLRLMLMASLFDYFASGAPIRHFGCAGAAEAKYFKTPQIILIHFSSVDYALYLVRHGGTLNNFEDERR